MFSLAILCKNSERYKLKPKYILQATTKLKVKPIFMKMKCSSVEMRYKLIMVSKIVRICYAYGYWL